ncbi:hypothetical protein V3C99_008719 [Haemonchus contortus]|uniref:Costars domain-containing protein n=1 Tax=Haemonchus contortus TaxID=6289 RepID=A0A7I4Y3E5_HAECO
MAADQENMENPIVQEGDENNVARTDVKHIRGVLKTVQSSRTRTTHQVEQKQNEEKMDVEETSGPDDDVATADWSALRTTLEAAFGEIGKAGHHGRGAEIRSKLDKGHLKYVCEDGCLKDIELGDLEKIQFLGAFSDGAVSCAKALYENVRKRMATSVPLPELKRQEFVSMRTSTTQGGGMWQCGMREVEPVIGQGVIDRRRGAVWAGSISI